jgi:hypothetical protein
MEADVIGSRDRHFPNGVVGRRAEFCDYFLPELG